MSSDTDHGSKTGAAGSVSRRGFAALSGAAAVTACSADGFLGEASGVTPSQPHAESPTAGMRVLCDPLSLRIWGLNHGVTTSADGALQLADNPDDSHPRGQLLRCAASSGSAFHTEWLRFFAHGQRLEDADFGDVAMRDFYWQAELAVVEGSATVFAAYAEPALADPVFALGVRRVSGGFRFVLDGEAGATTYPLGGLIKARIGRKDGALTLETNTGTGWQSEAIKSGLATSGIIAFRWGCLGAAEPCDIRFSATAISDTGFDEMDRDFYLAGSGTRDRTHTQAALALFCPQGLFRGAEKARVRYAVGTDPSGGAVGEWVALDKAAQNIVPIGLSGLAPDTPYAYQFEIGDAAGAVIHASDPYRFRTLAKAGESAASQINFESCHVNQAYGHPYRDDAYTVKAAGESYLGTLHLGDQYYECAVYKKKPKYLEPNPPITRDDFEVMLREFASDFAQHAKFRRGPFIATPDDHQWINEGDATTAPGGANADTLADAWYGAQNANHGLTPVSTLWTNGLGLMDDWFTRHLIDRPSERARYKHWVHGQTELILLDTRTERIPSQQYISATQLAWVKQRIAELAPTTKLVIFAAQSSFSSFSAKRVEGWERHSQAQWEYFFTTCAAAIPAHVNFAFVSGDDHLVYALHKKLGRETTLKAPANWLGEIRASGNAMLLFQTNLKGAEWAFDQKTVAGEGRSLIRGSGVMATISADARRIDLGVEAAGSARVYPMLEPDEG